MIDPERLRINFDDPSLDLYIQYDSLPARQLSDLLAALDDLVYSVGAVFTPPSEPLDLPAGFPISLIPELCVEHISTGNSIGVSLKFKKNRFRIRYKKKKGEFEVTLPKWASVVVLSSLLLGVGADKYKSYLEIQKLRMEIQQIEESLGGAPLEKMEDRDDPDVISLNAALIRVQEIILNENITYVEVNGIPIKEVHNKSEQDNR